MPPSTSPRVNPEGRPVRIGFIPVTDCAPLIAAERLGLFSEHRLDVTLHCEVGWASIREKLVHGQLDGAHAVAGLILALRLGLQGSPFPVISPFIFSLQGNAITLSTDLWNRGVRDAVSLRKLIRSQKSKLLTFGVVTHFSAHNFLMRRWLESGGIDPAKDVRIIPFPPSLMPENLANGLLDGFCAGEPWNSQAVATGSGWCPATSADLDPLHPEKALILSENFAAQNPAVVATLCSVFTKACAYCDAPENRPQVVEWLAQSGYFTANRAVLAASLIGPFETGASPARSADSFHIFSRHGTNTPTADHARWLLDACRHHDLLPAASQQQAARELAKAWSLPRIPAFTPTKKQKQHQPVS